MAFNIKDKTDGARRGRPLGRVPFHKQETRFSVAVYLVLTEVAGFNRDSACEFAVFFAPKITQKQRAHERLRRKADETAAQHTKATTAARRLFEIEYLKISPEIVCVSHVLRHSHHAGRNLLRKADGTRREIANCPRSQAWLQSSNAGLILLIAGWCRNDVSMAVKGIKILLRLGWGRTLVNIRNLIIDGTDRDLSATSDGDAFRNQFGQLQRKHARRLQQGCNVAAA